MERVGLWALRHFSWLLAGGILLVMLVTVPAFTRIDYWLLLARQSFPLAAMALALTPVILTGGIDLSVGSLTALTSVVVAVCLDSLGWPLFLALLAGVGAGLLAGLGNGGLICLGVPPLVATLATRELLRGQAFSLSAGSAIRFSPDLTEQWTLTWFGLPAQLFLFLLLTLLVWFIVHHTWMGRMLFAIGDNEQAARFAAVPIRSLRLGCYAAVGAVAGLCGALSVLHYGAARPDSDTALELLAIAAVVLGGVRITGGAGHVGGVLLGIVTLLTLQAGLQRVPAEWRDSITGVLLLTVALANETALRWLERRPSG